MQKINCKQYANEILNRVRDSHSGKELWIFTMGDDPASQAYMRGKRTDADYCGIKCEIRRHTTLCGLLGEMAYANADDRVGGIIVQLPLPDGINADCVVDYVHPNKDVDGFNSHSPFKPCTPEGVMWLLHRELGDLSGKTALVIGKGKLVGRPLFDMLLADGVTATMAHSRTRDLDSYLSQGYDIIVSAVGKPRLVDLKRCRADIVVDVGINRDDSGRLCGDCYNFDPDDGSTMRVTTVPGGVGLLTRAMLMDHMRGDYDD